MKTSQHKILLILPFTLESYFLLIITSLAFVSFKYRKLNFSWDVLWRTFVCWRGIALFKFLHFFKLALLIKILWDNYIISLIVKTCCWGRLWSPKIKLSYLCFFFILRPVKLALLSPMESLSGSTLTF